MPVFSLSTLGDLSGAVSATARDFFLKTPLVLTPDEFLQAFILPEHVAESPRFIELFGFVGATVLDTTVNGVKIRGNFPRGEPPAIIPLYVRNGMSPECPAHLRARIEDWVHERVWQGRTFGRLIAGLEYLNEHAADAKGITMFIPCLPTLFAEISEKDDDRHAKKARSLATSSRAPKMVRMAPTDREMLLHASAFFSAAHMARDHQFREGPKGTAYLRRFNYEYAKEGQFLGKDVIGY